MAYEAVLYDVTGGVATITINRPERRNALSWQVMTELRDAFEVAKDDDDVRVVVLTGAGDKAFCAGADLTGMAADAGWAAAARRARRAGALVPRDVGARQADHREGPRLRARGRVRAVSRVRPRHRGGRRAVRHARDRRRPVAVHDHRAAHAIDAAEEGVGADDDRPPRRRGGGRAHRVRRRRSCRSTSSTTRWTSSRRRSRRSRRRS